MGLSALDVSVAAAVHALRAPWLTGVMRVWTVLGGTLVVTAVVVMLFGLLWTRGRRDLAWFAAVSVGGGALLSSLLKLAVGRTRPFAGGALIELPRTASFPSGHTMASLCLAVAVFVLVREVRPEAARIHALAAAIGAVYAAGVAFSRVYLGVHWPSDVLGSWVLGALWCAVVFAVFAHTTRRGPASSQGPS